MSKIDIRKFLTATGGGFLGRRHKLRIKFSGNPSQMLCQSALFPCNSDSSQAKRDFIFSTVNLYQVPHKLPNDWIPGFRTQKYLCVSYAQYQDIRNSYENHI